jgi:hypothetical protein
MKSRAQRREEKLRELIREQISYSFERERLLDKLIAEEHYIGVTYKNSNMKKVE